MKPSSRPRGAGTRAKRIVFLAAPNTQILDVAGPFQIFVRAAELYVKGHPGQPSPYTVVSSVLDPEEIPYTLESYTDLGSGQDFEEDKHPSIPRRRALPGENDVVTLP